MPNLTVRASESLLAELDSEADAQNSSRAELVRSILHDRHAEDDRIADLESELHECKTECERLHSERRQLLAARDEHTALVKAVDERRTLERRRASAGVLTRAKWWLTGMDDGD